MSCKDIIQKNRDFSLNYPSISVVFRPGMKSKMIKKRFTNVGSPNSTYFLEVKPPNGIKVKVRPQRLTFKHINQSLSYRIWFISRNRTALERLSNSQGYLSWVNSHKIYHRIRIKSFLTVNIQNTTILRIINSVHQPIHYIRFKHIYCICC